MHDTLVYPESWKEHTLCSNCGFVFLLGLSTTYSFLEVAFVCFMNLQAMRNVRAAMESQRGDPFIEGGMRSFPTPAGDPTLPLAAPGERTWLEGCIQQQG